MYEEKQMTEKLKDITIEEYFMGRREKYKKDYLPEYEVNAKDLLSRVNPLLEKVALIATWVDFELHPENKSLVSSGWRPPAVNAKTPNSALKSKHMTCNAIDIYDPDGDIDDFLMGNERLLQEFGLSMEHASATKGWCHLQNIPPKSGKSIYYP
jgi:hypothetical protein